MVTAEIVKVTAEKPCSTSSIHQKHRPNAEADMAGAYFRWNVFYPFFDHIARKNNRRFPNEVISIPQVTYSMPYNRGAQRMQHCRAKCTLPEWSTGRTCMRVKLYGLNNSLATHERLAIPFEKRSACFIF